MRAAAICVVAAALSVDVARAQPAFAGVVVPSVGSVAAISGAVTGLAAAGGPFQVCAYKDSRTSTLWGPLTAPIGAADGGFRIEGWAANLWWDAVSPRILLFVTPAAFTCPLSEGLLDLPASIYDNDLLNAFFTRADPMRLDVTAAPLVGDDAAASVVARVTGLPEPAGAFSAVLYGMVEEGWLVGPLGPAGCGSPVHALRAVPGDPTAATVSIAAWVDPGVPPAQLLGFFAVVFPGAFVPGPGVCLNATSGALSIPLGLPAIASAFRARELPPSATPSRPASATATPSASGSEAPVAVIDAQGSPTAGPEGGDAAESAAGGGARAAAVRSAAAAALAVLVATAVGATLW